MTRVKLRHQRHVYTITFDEHGVLDTVERGCSLLQRHHPMHKAIQQSSDDIRAGRIPAVFKRA